MYKYSKEVPQKPNGDSRKKVLREIDRLLSRTTISRLRQKFGPLGLPFFEFYKDLAYLAFTGDSSKILDEDIWKDLRRRARMLSRTKLSPLTQNQLTTVIKDIKPWLRMVGRNPKDVSSMRKVLRDLGPLITEVAKDKGVYIRGIPLAKGILKWPTFRVMRPKEKQLEIIKDTDPALYEVILKQKGQLNEIEENIELSLLEAEMPYERGFIMGRTVFIGRDPATGERVVYDYVNKGLPYDRYLQKRKAENRAMRKQSRVFPDEKTLNSLRKNRMRIWRF